MWDPCIGVWIRILFFFCCPAADVLQKPEIVVSFFSSAAFSISKLGAIINGKVLGAMLHSQRFACDANDCCGVRV